MADDDSWRKDNFLSPGAIDAETNAVTEGITSRSHDMLD